jgi:peroxiredoxin
MPAAPALDLGMTAPDVVLETRVSGQTRTRHVALCDADTRWTVLVFEPEPTTARLREIEVLRTNFVAEDAALVVVSPPHAGICAEWERASTGLHSALDDGGELAASFGAFGPATFVLDPRGTVYDAHHGSGGEYVALALLQALRTGGPSLHLIEAARRAYQGTRSLVVA